MYYVTIIYDDDGNVQGFSIRFCCAAPKKFDFEFLHAGDLLVFYQQVVVSLL